MNVNSKAQVIAAVEKHAPQIMELAKQIGEHPELGFKEYQAAEWLCGALTAAGFEVHRGVAGMDTAFRAELGEGEPQIALLCEYDALPEIGHACGHNLIGTASVGAAVALAEFMGQLQGKLVVLGAPAEETGGGKVKLVEAGLFQSIDAAMMFHPSSKNLLMSTSNALDAYEFVFHGKAAHAAASPEEGINALDGVIQLFNGINALREHLKDDVRIHGIISEGGTAANIVPERAAARFYFRASTRAYLDEVAAKIFKIAEGAALMTGTTVQWDKYELSNDNFVPNRALAQAFGANLELLGVTDVHEYKDGRGSSDMGNVSHVVPAIHPYLSVGEKLVSHTPEFAAACLSPKGMETAVLAAKALALTAYDLLTDGELLSKVKAEHGQASA
ncbi:MAG: M20 family metallopeptidase [Firmicutes bacterium]|jgi:amidohydrolase|nr:M20 family metallopeptidase [Bacillota bacterium]